MRKEGREIWGGRYPDLVEKIEEDARVKWVERAEKPPGFLEFLSKVDFPLLGSLFRKIAERSGINSQTVNFLGSERISPRTVKEGPPHYAGFYLLQDNIISINYQRIPLKYVDFDPDLIALDILCHEEVHATSRTMCKQLQVKGGAIIEEQRMGYMRSIARTDRRSHYHPRESITYESFDEGVTEKLAQEILEEYVKSTGFASKEDLSRLRRARSHVYRVPVKLVEIIIRKISQVTGINKDLVWRSIVRGKYEGETFEDPDLRKLFGETISPAFLERLADDSQIKKLLAGFKSKASSK